MSEENRRLCVFSFLFIYMLCSLAQAALAYFIRAELGVVHFVLQLISGILCFSSGLNRMMTVTSLSGEGTSQVHCDTAGLWLALALELLVLVLLVLDRLGLLWHVVALGSQGGSSQILPMLRPSDDFSFRVQTSVCTICFLVCGIVVFLSMFERWFLYRSMEVTSSPGHWVFGNQNSTDRRPILQNSMNEEAETSGTSIIREESNTSPNNVKLQAYRHFNVVGTKSLVERPVTLPGYDLKESMIDHPDGRFMSCGQNSHMLTFKPSRGRDLYIRTKSFVYPGYGSRVPQGQQHEIVAIATRPTMGRHISILGRSDIVEDRTEQPPRFGLHCSHVIAFSPICSGGALSPATDPDDTTWASSSLEASPMGETVV